MIFNSDTSYTLIPHNDLVNLLQERTGGTLSFYKEQRNGKVAIGTVLIKNLGDHHSSVSFVNSIDKSRALKLAGGLTTNICLNGSVWGDYVQVRKHTGIIDLGMYIDKVTMHYSPEQFVEYMDKMKEIEVTSNEVARVLGDLVYYKKVVPVSLAQKIWNEHLKPSFNYGVNRDTAYNFYQACTYIMPNMAPKKYMTSAKALSDTFIETFKL